MNTTNIKNSKTGEIEITNQSSAQQLFNQSILEANPDCVKIIDRNGNIIFINQNGLCQLEIDDFATVKNKSWFDIIGKENFSLATQSLKKALSGEIVKFTILCLSPKGTSKWWDVILSPISTNEDSVQQLISISRDVTESKIAELKLKDSKDFFEITLNNIPSGVYHLNNKGQILYVNLLGAQQMGYDSVEEVLKEKDVYQFREKLDKRFNLYNESGAPLEADESCSSITLKTGQPSEVLIQFVDKNTQKSFWLLTKSFPKFNNEGQLSSIFFASTDITKQKEYEIKLKISELKYHSLFETMNQGLSIIEMIYDENNNAVDFRYLETNSVFNKESGLNNVIGKTIKELVPDIDNFWIEIYEKVLLTGEPVKFTQKADSMKSWFDVNAFRLGETGSKKVAIFFTNVTEQKKSEESIAKIASHFKLATDSANVGIWSLNVQSQELEWSDIHKTMWGYDLNRSDLTFNDWHAIILEKDKKLAFQRVENARINHTEYEVEYRIKRANDNEIRWMKSFGQYYYDELGEAVTLTGISLDVTEQKSFTKELEKKVTERTKDLAIKTKQLEQINKKLDKNIIELENANIELKSFSYIASHDLQEPLRIIRMFIQRIAQMERFSDKTVTYFNYITDATERMRNLIISLIDFSRLEKTDLKLVSCDLNTIVEDSKRDLQISIAEKQAVIEYENLPLIFGHQIQLSQLFTNIISNALKYSKETVQPKIEIKSKRIKGNKIINSELLEDLEYFAITFIDNGIGFEEEYSSRIFEAFQRLHGKNEYSGTGIGLFIVKKIVSNHKGVIDVKSKVGIGSTFTIYLPILTSRMLKSSKK